MFTPNGTFEEVFCWLSGFVWAEKMRKTSTFDEWQRFERWIQWKLNIPANEVWYQGMRRQSEDDSVLITMILEMFEELVKQKEEYEKKQEE